MVYCAAIGCTNDSKFVKGVGYYYVKSRKTDVQKQWIVKLRRKDLVVNSNTVVCGQHFEEDCFERDLKAELLNIKRTKKLKDDAVPTIFNFPGTVTQKRRCHTEARLTKKAKLQVLKSWPKSSRPFAAAIQSPRIYLLLHLR